jgi:hypothetical protein
MVTESTTTTRSYLLIQNMRQPDSGTYTCKPPYGKDASVKILVLDGENFVVEFCALLFFSCCPLF